MIRHKQFRTMLVWQDELSPVEQATLNRHLADCSDCRGVALLYAENRARLRVLAQLRPPPELRQAVIDAVEDAEIGFYLPAFLSFFTLPLSLLAAGAVLIDGAMASLWLIVGVLLLAGLVTWQGYRREAVAEMPLERDAAEGMLPLLRLLAFDLLGVAAGVALVTLLLVVLLAVTGHR